ncbi:nitrogenase stabilizing/protective protein NifW [Aromatoleum toluvorans]|uniref:Nitrogenase-stabilizing/protective protein NifW n=1 Tax=Aromatoleum toluvorans TaxID=92002 RepID=A0ABX1Q6V1_9RHOO|nr:nitrogenase stabilizing/protective protein NifW [Aromatoleum toluvorans]NMG46254.1 nitrogenase stabilizing/protective protein NifW [Aromatoleum toluvorans]
MSTLTEHLSRLSAAEEFLDFFAVPYQQAVVNVNRLHILKRFYQYLRQEKGLAAADDTELYRRYQGLLARAYDDFVRSTPAEEKVFKVFQEAGGARSVGLDALRTTLPSRR